MWIWSANVQTRCTWKFWLANLRNFLAADTFCASFHRNTTFTFAPGFVASSTIHTICGYIIAASQITHRNPAISNWNFWYCRFKRVWLQAEFFEVSHSFDFWLCATWRQRFLLEDILPNQMIRKLNLILLPIMRW